MKKFQTQLMLAGWHIESLTEKQIDALKILVDSNGFVPTPKEVREAIESEKSK